MLYGEQRNANLVTKAQQCLEKTAEHEHSCTPDMRVPLSTSHQWARAIPELRYLLLETPASKGNCRGFDTET